MPTPAVPFEWSVQSVDFTVVDGPYKVMIRRTGPFRYSVVVSMPDVARGRGRSTGQGGAVTFEEAIGWAKAWIEKDRAEHRDVSPQNVSPTAIPTPRT